RCVSVSYGVSACELEFSEKLRHRAGSDKVKGIKKQALLLGPFTLGRMKIVWQSQGNQFIGLTSCATIRLMFR
ncbi:MAG: hypothetical protein V1782_00165, partial [Pseudomonadota bacterium]